MLGAEERNAIAAVVSTATGIGVAIGQSLAGFLGPTYGWRLPFLIVSIPAFLCGFVLLFTPEPKRGAKERAVLSVRMKEACPRHQDAQRPQDDVEATPGPVKKKDDQDELKDTSVVEDDPRIVRSSTATMVEQITTNEVKGSYQPPVAVDINEMDHSVSASMDEIVEYEEEKATLTSTWEMCKTATVILTLLQGAPSVVPFAVASTYMNDYLAQDRGMTVEASYQ